MTEQLISFETAKLAKEKKFDIEVCPLYYEILKDRPILDVNIKYPTNMYLTEKSLFPAPTQTLLQKWLREKHNIQMFIAPAGAEPVHYLVIIPKCYIGVGEPKPYMSYSTYEEALEDGLKHALNLIK